MVKDIFINRLKCFIREKSLMFWTLLFPIVLSTFFYIAFNNIKYEEKFEPITLAVINDSNYNSDASLIALIKSISQKDENQVFDIVYVDEALAKQKLADDEVTGYLYVVDQLNLITKQNSVEVTITKTIFDNYLQVASSIDTILELNPEAIKKGILEIAYNNQNYIQNENKDNMDPIVLYYYSLIGMVALYAGFWGIKIVNESQANLSSLGARISVSKVHKAKLILSSFLAAYLLQLIIMTIVLAYIMLVLKIDFGTELFRVGLLTAIGSLAGMSYGTLIGTIPLKKADTKITIFTVVAMFLSFLSGLMAVEVKYVIAENLPFLGYINPATLITDGFYSLYYYSTYDQYNFNLVILCLLSLISYFIVYLIIRRQKYASI